MKVSPNDRPSCTGGAHGSLFGEGASPWDATDAFQLTGARALSLPLLVDGESVNAVVHYGAAGPAVTVDAIRVVWPDGTEETFPGRAVDQVVEVRKGEGMKSTKVTR